MRDRPWLRLWQEAGAYVQVSLRKYAVARRDNPQFFSRIALGGLQHVGHLFRSRRNDGQAKGPLTLFKQAVHIGIGAREFKMLRGVSRSLLGSILSGGLPLESRLHDVIEGFVYFGIDFLFGNHADGVRYRNKTEIEKSLAFLGTTGKGNKIRGHDGDRGDTELFNVALVNYQP